MGGLHEGPRRRRRRVHGRIRRLDRRGVALQADVGRSMRQVGSIAAAGLYALDNNVERLAEDHENARVLADGLAQLPGVEIDPSTVETNIVLFRVPDPLGLIASLAGEVELSPADGGRRVRAVTPMDA